MPGDVLRIQIGIGGLDGQPPAGGHRVPGVDDQVHDDLLDLAWIHLDRVQIRRRYHDQLDVHADETP